MTTTQELRRAAATAATGRTQAIELITAARDRKNAAYEDYLSAHRQRRSLGESRAALSDPRQDTSAQDAEFSEANTAFRELVREIYRSQLLRSVDIQEAASITRQRLHQILNSVN